MMPFCSRIQAIHFDTAPPEVDGGQLASSAA
jgi:hypothetical protein